MNKFLEGTITGTEFDIGFFTLWCSVRDEHEQAINNDPVLRKSYDQLRRFGDFLPSFIINRWWKWIQSQVKNCRVQMGSELNKIFHAILLATEDYDPDEPQFKIEISKIYVRLQSVN